MNISTYEKSYLLQNFIEIKNMILLGEDVTLDT